MANAAQRKATKVKPSGEKSSYAKRRLQEITVGESEGTKIIDGRRQMELRKMEALIAPSEYKASTLPIACDKDSAPSVVAELGAFLGTPEGKALLRQGMYSLMVNFAFGDKAAQKIVLGTAPTITQVDVAGIMAHVVTAAREVSVQLSPAELRRLEKTKAETIDATFAEVAEPVEVSNEQNN